MIDSDFTIRAIQGEAEARFCAEFMVASDPWITLGLTFDRAMQCLRDSSRNIFVATVEEKIVGLLVLHLSGPLNGYIQTIVVHPEWRCRGIGTRMLEWAEQRILRQSPNVFLCVSSFNTHARELYERLGYQRIGELPDLLVTGCSEILMRKTRGPLLGFKPEP